MTPTTTPSYSLVFHDDGITVGDEQIDIHTPTTTHRLSELLGPRIQTSVAGVDGIRRTAHWLSSGVVLVSDDSDERLVMFYVCFEAADSSPYPDRVAVVPAFKGTIQCGPHVFRGGESEDELFALPGIEGFSGMLGLRDGRVEIGFDLRKRRDRFGKRAGPRRLAQIVAEWAPLSAF